jgi:two-component system chemotaxis response regulator CheB
MAVEAVVIGASAGGIEAISQLLPAVRSDCRASFLIVLHLPREGPSLLREIFACRCALPVQEAEDKAPIESGKVYLAPPDYHLLVDVGPSLALSIDEPVHYSRPSIDVLFQSAADVYGERLLGIVLTGASADGAEGLAAVASAGGITVAQDPAEALAPALPTAAIRTARVSEILTLDRIRDLLAHVV